MAAAGDVLALGERLRRRQPRNLGRRRRRRADRVGAALGREPTPPDRLEEPPEDLADARRAGGTGDGEERLGQGAALGAAQLTARAKGLHLARKRLEVRVEHLRVGGR